MANTLAAAIERAEAEAEMRRRALHDPLTGLPNRTLVLDRLAHALAARGRRPGTIAVVLLDIDQFKVVNDTLGHDAGDELLLAVAPRLAERGAARRHRRAARRRRVRRRLRGRRRRGGRRRVAARLVAAFDEPFDARRRAAPPDGERRDRAGRRRRTTPGELLRNADAAMYRAKERGRGALRDVRRGAAGARARARAASSATCATRCRATS